MGRHVANSDTLSWFRANHRSSLLLLNTEWSVKIGKYKFHSLWFDPISARTHEIPHCRQVRLPLHHRCNSVYYKQIWSILLISKTITKDKCLPPFLFLFYDITKDKRLPPLLFLFYDITKDKCLPPFLFLFYDITKDKCLPPCVFLFYNITKDKRLPPFLFLFYHITNVYFTCNIL